jgi:hypothetical protein
MGDNEMDKTNPSVVVAGYIEVAPKDHEAFVKVLQAHVRKVVPPNASE